MMLGALLLAACHGDPPMVVTPQTGGPDMKEHLINANRTIAHSEETSIDEYVARRGWTMETLSNGSRVWEYQKGSGRQVAMEDSVRIRYSIEALNGKRLYDEMEERYVAGRRRDMVGLDEAVLALHYGSKAYVILPSALGYGIGGDGDRIPQSTVLVLKVEVKEANDFENKQ